MDKKKQIDRVITGRVSLLLNQPFFGNLVANLELVTMTEADFGGNKEMIKNFYGGTDGKRLYLNLEMIESLSKSEILFLFAHEVSHCVYRHCETLGNRYQKIWNMANDYVINGELVEHGIGTLIKRPDFEPCYDPKYTGMTSGEVYDLLIDEIKEKAEQMGLSFKAVMDNIEERDRCFDIHFDMNGDDDPDSDMFKDTPFEPLSAKEKAEIAQQLKQTVSQVYHSQKNAGTIPGGMKRQLQDLHEPKLDWKDYIETSLQSTVKNDYSFMIPAPKSWGLGFILPGRISTSGKCSAVIGLDMSGSITNAEAIDFLSEVKGMMEQFEDFKLIVWCFDTQVYNQMVFTPENLEEINDYETAGGGGTMFECNWKHMEEEEIEPEVFIMFTDGYPNASWGNEHYCDTIFLIHKNKHIKAPFGQTINYE